MGDGHGSWFIFPDYDDAIAEIVAEEESNENAKA